jgi:hypothetical protein
MLFPTEPAQVLTVYRQVRIRAAEVLGNGAIDLTVDAADGKAPVDKGPYAIDHLEARLLMERLHATTAADLVGKVIWFARKHMRGEEEGLRGFNLAWRTAAGFEETCPTPEEILADLGRKPTRH